MILDAIVSLLVGIFSALFEAATLVVIPLINLVIALIEAIIGIFSSGFTLKRLERKKRSNSRKNPKGTKIGIIFGALALSIVVLLFLGPSLTTRTVTLVAEDGHSLPLAAVIIRDDDGNRHERTDISGKVSLPRFGSYSLTIKDPRYIEKTWTKSELEPELLVERSILGTSLDGFAEKLLKRAKPVNPSDTDK